jgi:hypothetical protein
VDAIALLEPAVGLLEVFDWPGCVPGVVGALGPEILTLRERLLEEAFSAAGFTGETSDSAPGSKSEPASDPLPSLDDICVEKESSIKA